MSRRLSTVLFVLGLGLTLGSCMNTVPSATGEFVKAPTPTERLHKAVGQAPNATLDFESTERIGKYKGRVLADAPDKVGGIDRTNELGALLEDADVRAILEGNDEAAAAKLLREKDVRVVLLHMSVVPSVDRDGAVLNRLYHHDHLTHFRLFRIADGLLFYKVQDEPVTFDPKLATACIAYIRHRLKGGPLMRMPDVDSGDGSWTLAATIRGQGKELAVAFGQDKSLQGVLEEIQVDLENQHRRNIELLGHPPIAQHIDDLTIEIHRVTERAWVEPRDEATMANIWRMGIDGAYMMTASRKERGFLPGAVSYTRSIRSPDAFLRQVADQGGMSEKRPWRDRSAWLEIIRTIHYREVPGQGVAYMYRGVPAVPMSQVTVSSVKQAVVDAGEWYMNNLSEDGHVVYKMWPSDNRYSDEYNIVRHTLATWNLVQAWEMDPSRTEFLEGARRSFEFTQRFLVHEDNPQTGERMAFYNFNRNQKLGTVVIQLLGLIDLARATQSHEFDAQLLEMGNFIKFMQEDSGRVEGYYVPDGHPYKGQKNDIIPGEAALSLVYLADYFNDDTWVESLPKYFEYYEPWFNKRNAGRQTDQPWPWNLYQNQDRLDLVQFGPWTVMAANAYHRRTGDEKAAEFGLKIARWMIESYMWTPDTAPFPDFLGGYFKFKGELPAMQAFCYAEGTAAAYQLALRYKPEEAHFFELRTRESVRFALQMQYNEMNVYPFSRPDQVFGGVRYAMNETKVRVDYVHHALSAMYQWVIGAEEDPSLDPHVKNGPPTPVQLMRQNRLKALALAEETGDELGIERFSAPWGEPRIYLPPANMPVPTGPLDQSKPWTK